MSALLGSGTYGKVHRVVVGDKKYALKVSNSTFMDLLREIDILKRLESCPYVIDIKHIYCPDGYVEGFMMDIAPWTLHDLIVTPTWQRLAYSERRKLTIKIIHQLLQALHWLKVNQVVHNDIKPNNILLYDGTTWTVKLTDFGLSYYMMGDSEGVDPKPDPYQYAAPEIRYHGILSYSNDIYSVGCVMYQLLTCEYLVDEDLTESQMIQRIMARLVIFDDDEVVDLLTSMIMVHPNGRKSPAALLNHSIFKEYEDYILTDVVRPKSFDDRIEITNKSTAEAIRKFVHIWDEGITTDFVTLRSLVHAIRLAIQLDPLAKNVKWQVIAIGCAWMSASVILFMMVIKLTDIKESLDRMINYVNNASDKDVIRYVNQACKYLNWTIYQSTAYERGIDAEHQFIDSLKEMLR